MSKIKYERPMVFDLRPNQVAQGSCNPGSRDSKGGCSTGYSGGTCSAGGAISADSCGTGNLGHTFYCSTGVTTGNANTCNPTGATAMGTCNAGTYVTFHPQCVSGTTTYQCTTGSLATTH